MTALRRRTTTAAMALVIALLTVLMVDSPTASAAPTASQWDPGYIISDEQFYDYNSMSEAEIQRFLEARVPTCEPWRSSGPSDPIVCLKDFRMNTESLAADLYCPRAYVGATNERASTIIYKIAQACGINPKVLLVTLEKEMSLVTHTWPSEWRFRRAMGYACSDTAPCQPQFFGFQRQVHTAARQFQRYKANPNGYNYRAGQYNNIYYHPDTGRCGYSQVYIQNVATASLYNYTPYQPDAAALASMTGLGNSCSSYGNRNFWVLWWNWFGDPRTGIPLGLTLNRIGGANRYDSAVLISQSQFTGPVSVVYVATGANFPDALSAAPAAALAGGPLLLVESNRVPASVTTELARLAPQKIIVVGGPGAVSDAVLNTLKSSAPEVQRISGIDRYEVSRGIALAAFGASSPSVAYVATGANYPDALSASAAAGSLDAPVILVPGTQGAVDAATSQLLSDLGVTEVRIVGGPAVVSAGIESSIKALPFITTVTRFGGADRFAVSAAVNAHAFSASDRVYLASGFDFPDALAGAVVAGVNSAPLYVIPPTCIPRDVTTAITNLGTTKVTLLGGTGALGSQISSYRRC